MNRYLTLLPIAVVLAGCASTGNNFREDQLSELRAGMTESEVTVTLGGKPTTRAYNADGSYVAIWQFVSVVYVTATENKLVSLLFDKDGRFVRVINTVNVDPKR